MGWIISPAANRKGSTPIPRNRRSMKWVHTCTIKNAVMCMQVCISCPYPQCSWKWRCTDTTVVQYCGDTDFYRLHSLPNIVTRWSTEHAERGKCTCMHANTSNSTIWTSASSLKYIVSKCDIGFHLIQHWWLLLHAISARLMQCMYDLRDPDIYQDAHANL